MKIDAIFLVEIQLNSWVIDPRRTIAYEEVLAASLTDAKSIAMSQFIKRTKYEPIMHRRWDALHLSYTDIYAADAVQLDN